MLCEELLSEAIEVITDQNEQETVSMAMIVTEKYASARDTHSNTARPEINDNSNSTTAGGSIRGTECQLEGYVETSSYKSEISTSTPLDCHGSYQTGGGKIHIPSCHPDDSLREYYLLHLSKYIARKPTVIHTHNVYSRCSFQKLSFMDQINTFRTIGFTFDKPEELLLSLLPSAKAISALYTD